MARRAVHAGPRERRLRVVHVITALGTGGAERQVEYLVRNRRHDAEVICLYEAGLVAGTVRASGVPVTVLGMAGWRKPLAVARLVRELRRRRPDVVHVHLLSAQLWGIPAARVAGVPVVVSTEHSLMTDSIEGRPASRRLRTVYLGLAALASCTVAVSELTADRVRGWGVPARSVVVVENGIDLDASAFDPEGRRQTRTELGVGPGTVVVGAVGRLEPVKRLDLLLDAVAPLVRAGSVQVLVAGEGSLRPQLEDQIQRLGITAGVHLLGARADLGPVLAAMDVFVSPSADETFGMAVVEAAANGLPLVYGECPALDELPGDPVGRGSVRLPRDASLETQRRLIADAVAAARPRETVGAVPPQLRARYGIGVLQDAVDEVYRFLLAGRRPNT